MKRLASFSRCLGLLVAIAVVITADAQDRAGGERGRGGARGSAYQRFRPPDGAEKVSEDLEKTYARMSEQLQQPVPKRTFETATGPLKKIKLFRADPKLL